MFLYDYFRINIIKDSFSFRWGEVSFEYRSETRYSITMIATIIARRGSTKATDKDSICKSGWMPALTRRTTGLRGISSLFFYHVRCGRARTGRPSRCIRAKKRINREKKVLHTLIGHWSLSSSRDGTSRPRRREVHARSTRVQWSILRDGNLLHPSFCIFLFLVDLFERFVINAGWKERENLTRCQRGARSKQTRCGIGSDVISWE